MSQFMLLGDFQCSFPPNSLPMFVGFCHFSFNSGHKAYLNLWNSRTYSTFSLSILAYSLSKSLKFTNLLDISKISYCFRFRSGTIATRRKSLLAEFCWKFQILTIRGSGNLASSYICKGHLVVLMSSHLLALWVWRIQYTGSWHTCLLFFICEAFFAHPLAWLWCRSWEIWALSPKQVDHLNPRCASLMH